MKNGIEDPAASLRSTADRRLAPSRLCPRIEPGREDVGGRLPGLRRSPGAVSTITPSSFPPSPLERLEEARRACVEQAPPPAHDLSVPQPRGQLSSCGVVLDRPRRTGGPRRSPAPRGRGIAERPRPRPARRRWGPARPRCRPRGRSDSAAEARSRRSGARAGRRRRARGRHGWRTPARARAAPAGRRPRRGRRRCRSRGSAQVLLGP